MITTAHSALAQPTPVSVALCCALSPPAVLSQPGQKLHFQPSTNQLCLRGAVLPKLVLLLYYFQRAVRSWDSLSVSVISTHSDYLRNEAKQISLIFSLHLHYFLFSSGCLGLAGVPLFTFSADNWLCSMFEKWNEKNQTNLPPLSNPATVLL